MPSSGPIDIQEIALRLSAAALAGAAIGLNRDLRGKPAGVRTHALVTLGAAVSSMLALETGLGAGTVDANAVGRVVQGIVTGIGFLGAGVILRDASGHVSGLTTAATIWLCAALGILCGMGYWSILLISIGLALIVLLVGGPAERAAGRYFKKRSEPPPGQHS
jgi:putative Mg2+ transporter-C (MgtC) family protein